MKHNLSLFAAILIVVSFTFSKAAWADVYQVFNLSNANANNVVGIDDDGNVVISSWGPQFELIYRTYNNGLLVETSSTRPDLAYDNGTPCDVPDGFSLGGQSVCNNGRTGFGSVYNPNNEPAGVYVGDPADLTRITGVGFDVETPVMNAHGDFVWVSGQMENIYVAIDLTSRGFARSEHVSDPGGLRFAGAESASIYCVTRRRLSLLA